MEECVFALVLFFHLFVTNANENTGCCGIDSTGACTKCCTNNYMFEKLCQACPEGFWGDNCSHVCQYPYYGQSCLQKCTCDEHICDKAKGCLDSTRTYKSVLTRNTSSENVQTSTETPTSQIAITYQSTLKKDGMFDDKFSIQTIIIAVSVTLGMSLFAIILLVVLLYRKREVDGVVNINTHELQIIRQPEGNSGASTSLTINNAYRNMDSVLGNHNRPDMSESRCRQDGVKTCVSKESQRKEGKLSKSRYEKLAFDKDANDTEESDED